MKWTTKYVVAAWAALAPAVWAADALDSWTASDSGTPNNLNAVAYGNGQFVAVGDAGTILTAQDGAAWTKRNWPSPLQFNAVTFGGGQFIAAGSTILTSPDSIKWAEQDKGIDAGFGSIVYGNGLYVAVGGTGTHGPAIISSSDGVKWSQWTLEPFDPSYDAPALTGIAYGNGRFVAVYPGQYPSGNLSMSFTSTNGLDWVPHGIPRGIRAVTFGNGQFVGVGGFQPAIIAHGLIYSSTDGINWALQKDIQGDSSAMFNGVTYGGGQFVAVVGDGFFRSGDGKTWTGRPLYASTRATTFGNGQFITVGGGGAVMRSGTIGKLGASLGPDGQFLGSITGINGQSFAILSSTNFGNWMDLTQVTVSNGIAQFSDPSLTSFGRRFYKAMGIFQ